MPLFWVLNKWNWVYYAGILSVVTSHAPYKHLEFFDSFVFWRSQDLSQCMLLREVGTWWLVKHFALTTYLIWSHIPPVSPWLTSNFPESQAWSTGTSYLGFHGDNGSWEDGPCHIYHIYIWLHMHGINIWYVQNVWYDRSNLLPIVCCQSSYLSAQLQLRIMVWDNKCFYMFETWQLSYCWLAPVMFYNQ